MDQLEKYKLAFDEINEITTESYKSTEGMNVEERTTKIADDMLSTLINAYKLGADNTADMLEDDSYIEVEEMRGAIYEVIDGKTFEDRVAVHVAEGNEQGLQTLAVSEFHRVYNRGSQTTADKIARHSGKNIMKEWITAGDERVRDTHDYLEGMKEPLNTAFYTYDGDYAQYPGGFKLASNNVNCRCIIKYSYL